MTGWNLPPGVTDRMIDEVFGYDEEEYVATLEEKAQEGLDEVKAAGLTWRQLRDQINKLEEDKLDKKILMGTRQHDEDEISSDIYLLTDAEGVLVGTYFATDPGRGGYILRDVLDEETGEVHSIRVTDELLGD